MHTSHDDQKIADSVFCDNVEARTVRLNEPSLILDTKNVFLANCNYAVVRPSPLPRERCVKQYYFSRAPVRARNGIHLRCT